MTETLGFIGIGALGGPIARKLMSAGHGIVAFDTDPARCAEMEKAGATIVGSARAVADRTQIVFACLPAPEISRRVATEIAEARTIRLLIELSTLGVPTAKDIATIVARTGIDMLDCPIVGGAGGSAVASGNIAAIVAGPRTAFDHAKTLLDALTERIFFVGETHGQAQICKMVNNAIGITSFTIACEAMVMGTKAGIDPRVLLNVVNAGSGRCVATEDKFFRSVLPRKLGEPGSIEIGLKDISLYVETLQQMGLPPRIGATIMDVWQGARNEDPERSYSSLVEIFERDAGIMVKG